MDKIIKDLDKVLFRQAQKPIEERIYIEKMYEYFNSEMKREWAEDEKVIWFSETNSKTGMVSYSTAPLISCMVNGKIPPCAENGNCYAISDMRLQTVRERAVHNTVLILRFPEAFKESLRKLFMMNVCMRCHVEGDFVNLNEIEIIDEVCAEFPHTQFNAYTKKYALMNYYIRTHKTETHQLNGGFKLAYSEWKGLPMDNPYGFPVVHVYSTLREYLESNDSRKCGYVEENMNDTYTFHVGNCRKCFENHIMNNGNLGGGCFDLKQTDNPNEIESVGMLAH